LKAGRVRYAIVRLEKKLMWRFSSLSMGRLTIKEPSMKFAAIALAAAVAFSGTVTVAQATKEKPVRKVHRDNAKVRLQPNYGNPNGDPNGPTSLSGTGSSQFGGSSPGTSGRN
jgi:hypothetical protein